MCIRDSSQADHSSPSNAPHVTLTAGVGATGEIADEEAVDVARVVGPMLPSALRVGGTVLFGHDRPTVAWLLEPPADLALAVHRHAVDRAPGSFRAWIPHLTLARRVPRDAVPRVLATAAARQPREVVADRLLLWRPGPRTLTTLVGPVG